MLWLSHGVLRGPPFLFSSCPLIQSVIDCIQYLLFSLFRAPILLHPPAVRYMLFGFSSDELLCVFSYLWNLCKFWLGASGMTIVFARYHLVPLSSWLVLKSRANCSPVLSFNFSFILGFGSVLSSSGHLYWMYWASVFNGNFWVFFRLVFYWGILCIFGLCSLVLVTFIGCTRLVFFWHCGSFFPSLGCLY